MQYNEITFPAQEKGFTMISTITVSTVSTVTLAGSFAFISILILLALLIQKELISTSTPDHVHRLKKFLNFGIFPLILVFVAMVVFKITQALN
jgi:hypothetical protein